MHESCQGKESPESLPNSRRAWATVGAGLGAFVLLIVGFLYGAIWIREHATENKTASAAIISGDRALWRGSSEDEWTLFDSSIELGEGDELLTEPGTVVWVTLFDGSTVEMTEGTHIRLLRLRVSRFSDSTLQSRLELVRGSIYGTMAPIETKEYGEFEVVSKHATLLASESRAARSSISPSFVVEVRDESASGRIPYRAATFRGHLEIESGSGNSSLSGNEQLEITSSGELLRSGTIRSEVIANGSFESGFAGWETIYSAEGREPEENIGRVEIVDPSEDLATAALGISRSSSSVWALTGARQTLDRTLRLPAALTLSFDIRVENQGQPLNGRVTIPIAIELDYVDILGQERSWTAAYMIRRDEGIVDSDAFSIVEAGEWTKVIVDLRNLEPIPRTLGTLVVYASGGGYESLLANLSLTVGEGTASS